MEMTITAINPRWRAVLLSKTRAHVSIPSIKSTQTITLVAGLVTIIAAESTVSGFGTSVQFGIWSCIVVTAAVRRSRTPENTSSLTIHSQVVSGAKSEMLYIESKESGVVLDIAG